MDEARSGNTDSTASRSGAYGLDHEEVIVPPPYGLEDAAVSSADQMAWYGASQILERTPQIYDDSPYSHGLQLGRAPQIRSDLFVGRDEELRQLGQMLESASTRNVAAIAAVGGLGKTQLAIAFAEMYHEKYSSVFWLDAQDEQTLKQDLAEVADIVLDHRSRRTEVAEREAEAIKQVKSWFSLANNNRWLLILDNYDDPKLPGLMSPTGYDIRKYFPARNQGSILITTRSQRLSFAKQLVLRKLQDPQQSLEILSLRAGRDLTADPDATELVHRLDGFPLALTTAGAYLSQSTGHDSIREYSAAYDNWAELEATAEELLEYGNGDETRGRTLFTTWNLSLEKVRQQNANAANMMRLLAFFGNSGINFGLFRTAKQKGYVYKLYWLNDLTESKITFDKAMTKLHDYSLVERSQEGFYSLHPCVHDWALRSLNASSETEYFYDALLSIAANVALYRDKDFWERNNSLHQHVLRIEQTLDSSIWKLEPYEEPKGYSLHQLATFWFLRFNYEKAERFQRAALDVYESSEELNAVAKLNVIHDLGSCYQLLDKFDNVGIMFQRASLGYEMNLAQKLKLQFRLYERHGDSFEWSVKLTDVRLRLRRRFEDLGTVDPDRQQELQSALLYADFFLDHDIFPEASVVSNQVVEHLEHALGRHHPMTLEALEIRARVLLVQGQDSQARALFEEVLLSWNEIARLDDMTALRIVGELADIHRKQLKLEELIELQSSWRQAIENPVNRHLDILGRTFLRMGNDEKAGNAFQNSTFVVSGIHSWNSLCDGHQTQRWVQGELLGLTVGRFICRQCDDVDLCRKCYETHVKGNVVLPSCIGHSFYEVPLLGGST